MRRSSFVVLTALLGCPRTSEAPNGKVEATWATNNGVVLDWVVDLDGDGRDEAVLHRRWLEDGMEEIHLLVEEGRAWDARTLYVSDSP
jgi:hypothetical protein